MEFKGIGVVKGQSNGHIQWITDKEEWLNYQLGLEGKKKQSDDLKVEADRLKLGRETARQQLHACYERTKRELGLVIASIVEGYEAMICDDSFYHEVMTRIRESGESAQASLIWAAKQKMHAFDQTEDEYLKERALDVRDVAVQWLLALHAQDVKNSESDCCMTGIQGKDLILAGDEITVSDLLNYEFHTFNGLVSKMGAPFSHAAVIAKTLEIPMIIQLRDLKSEWNGKSAHINGESGKLTIEL